MASIEHVAYRTEYTDNYNIGSRGRGSAYRNKASSGLFDGKAIGSYPGVTSVDPAMHARPVTAGDSGRMVSGEEMERDPAVFQSELYPSMFRETVIHKDDRGKYIDPFKNIANKPYGRRLMYDPSHPDKMYPSLWSSELADHNGCYSFPTTTGLNPDIPFRQDLQWQANGEVGNWPTDHWRAWTQVAVSPPYDGHDDQAEYSQYKVHVP